jgi:hypothetical protein
MSNIARVSSVLFSIALFQSVALSAPVVIDTTIGWNGAESLAPFGDGGAGANSAAEVYGQTFVAPNGAPKLTDWSFWLQHSPTDTSDQDLYFSLVVMEWNVDRATGPVLYESDLRVITPTQSSMTEYAFDIGDLLLTPDQDYVAFLNANNEFWNIFPTAIRVGWRNENTYAEGAALSLKTFTLSDWVTTTPWVPDFGTQDFVFRATFAPVPVPAAAGLFGSALAFLNWMRRKVT